MKPLLQGQFQVGAVPVMAWLAVSHHPRNSDFQSICLKVPQASLSFLLAHHSGTSLWPSTATGTQSSPQRATLLRGSQQPTVFPGLLCQALRCRSAHICARFAGTSCAFMQATMAPVMVSRQRVSHGELGPLQGPEPFASVHRGAGAAAWLKDCSASMPMLARFCQTPRLH